MRKTGWWVLLLAIVGLAAGCKEVPTQAAPAAPTGACANPKVAPSGPIRITSGGLQRTYLLSLPSPLPTKPAPVIVNLHGAGSDKGQQAVYSQLAVKGPARGFVVVTPDATGQPQQWNIIGQTKSDDVKFIDDLIVDLATRACIDPTRLYATGISSGAAMSSVLACREGERFRAIAPVAGVVFFGPVCSAGPPVTVIAFHGTQDPILPYNGGPVFGGGGTRYPGVAPAMAGWATRGGCKSSPETEAISQHVTLQRWPGCTGGATVELYVVDGGGHTWPGSIPVRLLGVTTTEINATDILLDAFSR